MARLEGHTGSVNALAVLPDGRLASGAGAYYEEREADNTIRLWDLKSYRETGRLEGHTDSVNALAVLPDGRLASASTDGTIRFWDPNRAEAARFDNDTSPVNTLVPMPGARLASGYTVRYKDQPIRVWDVDSAREIVRFNVDQYWAMTALPDGRLALAGNDTIRLWDIERGIETARLEGHAGPVKALLVLPDGRLAAGSGDAIHLWDCETATLKGRLQISHTSSIFPFVIGLAMMPNGQLVSASEGNIIRLWDLNNGAEISRIDARKFDKFNALAVLPDGRLATSWPRLNDPIQIWDLKSGALTAQLEVAEPVNALAVLPDGRLASGSDDRTIRLWDPRSATELVCLEVDARVKCLALLPNGRLVAGDDMGRLHWLEIVD